MSTISFRDELSGDAPEKALTRGFKRSTGRNNRGRITTRHKGGGHKRLYREIDFSFDKKGVSGRVETIEYDPNRTGFISKVLYKDGDRRYVLLPKGVKVGDEIITAENAELKPGNRLSLKNIPIGSFIYNVELKPGGGARIARSAGIFAQLSALEGGDALIKMPSTEVRKVKDTCWASLGTVSNEENRLVNIGKAGRSRWLGIRPTVRGSAMNPVDHPYGGGEGRQGIGRRRLVTRWGKQVGKGQKSRRSKKYSNVSIVSRRNKAKNKAS